MDSQKSTRISKRRKITRDNKKHYKILFLILILAAVFIFNINHEREESRHSEDRYYFSDSKYEGIKSRFVNRRSDKENTIIEYPITGNNFIDRMVSDKIDEYDTSFKQFVESNLFNSQIAQNVGYQISYNDNRFMSLILSIRQDTQGSRPILLHFFWTFDKEQNRIVQLNELTEGSADNINSIINTIKDQINNSLKEKNQETDLAQIPNDELMNFIIVDKETISWQFGRGQILPASFGDIITYVKAGDISNYIDNDFARKIFSIPEKPKSKPSEAISSNSNNECFNNGCVALTFDDGPSIHTSRLLDILKSNNAKATFYVLGSQSERNPNLIRRMKNEGHQIGNHTWSHPNLAKLSAEQIRQELKNTNDIIKSITNDHPKTIRPPYGSVNSAVMDEVANFGMSSILWSVDTRDWADRDSQIVCSRAVSSAKAGSIILLHDIHSTSVDSVGCIIDGLRKQGYKFATVDEILPVQNVGVNYYSGQ